MERRYRCSCGARGDLTELVEHAVTALETDDGGAHQWLDGEEPDQVAAARAARERRAEGRRRLAGVAGVPAGELREAPGR